MQLNPRFLIEQARKPFAAIAEKRRKKRLNEFVAYIQSLGLSIVKLKTISGVQYIEGADGSWRKVGGRTEDPDVKALLNAISHKMQSVKQVANK